MLKSVNYIHLLSLVMKTLNVLSFTEALIKKLGLTKIYYWFNK